MIDTITLDGSAGEGGGQVLRSALTLSLATGRPFQIENIRARRSRPGLQQQHLTAVRAAAEIGQANVEGAAKGSQRLRFVPGNVRPGEYQFAVGTAGSATLVLQTVLPALMTAAGPSQLTLEGGTHNPWAPPFDFLQETFLPIVRRMGPDIEASLQRPGFYPAGGGLFRVGVVPVPTLRRVDLPERGRLVRCTARAVVSRLPAHIAQREIDVIRKRMSLGDECVSVETVDAAGPGNCLMIEVQSERLTEVFTGFGKKGVPAERVADGAVREAKQYLGAEAAVAEHLADQLLIPMTLAGGGTFTTLAPSSHLRTNIDVVRRFLDVEITAEQRSRYVWQIAIRA
ncbi:MAG: RNA 3'-terminal phosphate cyclase [Pirellulales bacterium]|nr:RNA 3'-terminal phosphate cyclase [Pirellulales bacterium]